MVDWLLELRGAETGAAAGQNDKNNENSLFLQDIVSVAFVSFESLQLAGLVMHLSM